MNNSSKTTHKKNEVSIRSFWKIPEALFAVDGSLIQLPNSDEIISEFGCLKNQYGEGMPSARISTCYDILNEIILDSQIDTCATHEYDLALKHLEKPKQKDFSLRPNGKYL